jgi:hypothetical protein
MFGAAEYASVGGATALVCVGSTAIRFPQALQNEA